MTVMTTEQQTMMTDQVVGVRFHDVGKVYHFTNATGEPVSPGDYVVVETSRGVEIGQVAKIVPPEEAAPPSTYKPILRRATSHDLVLHKHYEHLAAQALKRARMLATELGIRLKLARAEYSFDGSRLTFLYGSEGDVNIKSLRRRLKDEFDVAIEFRQIGPRDVARFLGGAGACGLDKRCCSAFLTEFQPISIRMAKAQDLPLVPTEIAGMCGRLRCCLAYEYEFYKDVSKGFPKVGKWVVTEQYSGKVVDRNMLKGTITLQTEDHGRVELPVENLWVGKSGKPPSEVGCGEPGSSCGGACAAPPHDASDAGNADKKA